MVMTVPSMGQHTNGVNVTRTSIVAILNLNINLIPLPIISIIRTQHRMHQGSIATLQQRNLHPKFILIVNKELIMITVSTLAPQVTAIIQIQMEIGIDNTIAKTITLAIILMLIKISKITYLKGT